MKGNMDKKYILENFRREVMRKIERKEKITNMFWLIVKWVAIVELVIATLVFIYIAAHNISIANIVLKSI
jgi:Trk-type K+ transport system membrane component